MSHNERLKGKPRYMYFGDEVRLINCDWEFIEKFYPNFYKCEDIALHEDLEKILTEEDAEDSEAHRILNEWYDGQRESAVLYDDYMALSCKIMAKAINNFQNQK